MSKAKAKLLRRKAQVHEARARQLRAEADALELPTLRAEQRELMAAYYRAYHNEGGEDPAFMSPEEHAAWLASWTQISERLHAVNKLIDERTYTPWLRRQMGTN